MGIIQIHCYTHTSDYCVDAKLSTATVPWSYVKTCRHFVRAVEGFLDKEDDLLSMLSQIRAVYTTKMKKPNFSLATVSIEGTLADAITEVPIHVHSECFYSWSMHMLLIWPCAIYMYASQVWEFRVSAFFFIEALVYSRCTCSFSRRFPYFRL